MCGGASPFLPAWALCCLHSSARDGITAEFVSMLQVHGTQAAADAGSSERHAVHAGQLAAVRGPAAHEQESLGKSVDGGF
jgi:hypothetical protein